MEESKQGKFRQEESSEKLFFLLSSERKADEDSTRAFVWTSFGLVSRVNIELQANDSRFLSIHLFTLRWPQE